MSVFIKRELIKRSLFSGHKKQNFLIEVENVLAEYENHFEDVPKDVIEGISIKYKVSFKKECKEEAKQFVRRYWKSALNDMKSTEDEEKQADYLVSLLGLSKKEADDICSEEKGAVITPFVNGLLDDRRYSLDDEEKIKKLSEDLNITINFTNKEVVDKYRVLWEIENGKLPIINDVDITVQKSETVFFKDSIGWYEDRQITTSATYHGPTARIRICKGVYYRIGSIAPSRETTTEMRLIDTGTMYLTNKRLIFVGSKGTKTILFNKILSIEPYSDGVKIIKDSGKNPFIKFSTGDAEVFALLLTTIVNME